MNSYYLIVNPATGMISKTGFTRAISEATRFDSFSSAQVAFRCELPTRWAIVKISEKTIDLDFGYRFGFDWSDTEITKALKAWGLT